MRQGIFLVVGLFLLVWGCSTPAQTPVTLEVDGKIYSFSARGTNVREVLAEAGVKLGPYDKVEPDLWVEVGPGTHIRVIRVEYKLESIRRPIPFESRVIRSEALTPGERKLVQPGISGEEEIIYRVTLENGVEKARDIASTRVITPAQDEVIVVGVEKLLSSVPVSGTIAYISGGNAWLMRFSSNSRRPITTWGDLDGRVFELSPDGKYLLFTRREEGNKLNSLWVVTATIAGEEPRPLGLEGILYAEWEPATGANGIYRFAYSTGEKTAGSPGWKAHNNLWIATWRPFESIKATPVITAWESIPYGWWGVNFRWIPGKNLFAWATAESIGVLDGEKGVITPLISFAPYYTYGEWVWVPTLSPSPEGDFIVTVVHGPPVSGEQPQESPLFDVWVLSLDGQIKIRWAENTGMWSSPHWSPSYAGKDFILYGQANEPFYSRSSLYKLYLADRDGSNRRVVFPPPLEPGLQDPSQVAWSPYSPQFVASYQGNLYLVDVGKRQFFQLTGDGNSFNPRWAK
ncbi:MAG: G5 domain-containing protein [Anaerolineae bacterium]|nr:G5 domain-containing protein [Anaerolineae bacterium]MDW8102645.1 G5 domain-containing protein [Anaerolineae bacterium]